MFSRTSSSSIARWIAGLDLTCATTPAAPPAALAAFFLAAISSQLPSSFPPGMGGAYPGCDSRIRRIGRRSDLVGRALHGDLDALPEPALGFHPRPLRIELVGDVGEDHLPGLREPGVLARFARREVAPRPLALRTREGRLDEQEVGVARELDERLGRGGVGAEGEAPVAVRGPPGHRGGAGEVRDLVEREGERPDRGLLALAVLGQVEGVLDELLGPPRPGDPPEHVA